MEKYVYGTRFERKTGFLKAPCLKINRFFRQSFALAAALICVCSFLQPPVSAAESAVGYAVSYEDLRFELIEPDEKPSFLKTNSDCSFAANIPGALPAEVEVLFENPSASAVFKGFEKTALPGGTKLVYSVRFIQAGNIKLEPAQIRIRGKTYALAFPSLTVLENPDLLIPEFFFTAVPSAGKVPAARNSQSEQTGQTAQTTQTVQTVQAGKPLRVRLMGRYFKRIHDIRPENPEDALLEEAGRFFNPDAETVFEADGGQSSSAVPIAEFLYTPFFEGIREFPQTEVNAESYSGTSYTIRVPPLILHIAPAPEPAKKAQTVPGPATAHTGNKEGSLSQSTPEHAPSPEEGADTDENIAAQLARLRLRERHSPAFWIFRSKRKALEKKLLLQNPDEASLFWTLAAAVLLCILPAVIFVLLKRNRAPKTVLSLCVLVCFCVFFLIKNIPQLRQPALIAHKAVLRTIPETGAQGSAPLQEGTRLKILHKSGDWYLAADGQRSGWILKSEGIQIQNKEDK